MNGDDDHDEDWKDVEPNREKVTHDLIEILRRVGVCLFPGPRQPAADGDIKDFGESLPYVGDCGALIFCAPGHDKNWAHARIQYYVNSGDFDLTLNRGECVGVDGDWIVSDVLFPNKSQNLLIAPNDDVLFPHRSQELLVAPNDEPPPTKPPDHQFWARYVALNIIGRGEKLHVLHIGLHGDYIWPYFLAPHGIRAERIITNPWCYEQP